MIYGSVGSDRRFASFEDNTYDMRFPVHKIINFKICIKEIFHALDKIEIMC
jgi:hypothetical protein